MATSPKPTAVPATSRLALLAAALAGPVAFITTLAIGLLLIGFGIAKLIPGDVIRAPDHIAGGASSVGLLSLATGGVVTTTWGLYLVGGLQVLLGVGLLVPAARAVAGLGCLLAAAAVIVGIVFHWGDLTTGNGLNASGVSLLALTVLLLAGAALGTRAAAKQTGSAA